MLKHRWIGWLTLLLPLLLFGSCGAGGDRPEARTGEPLTGSGFILDTFVSVTIYDSQDRGLVDGALALCAEYEKVFSRTDPESELYALNRSGNTWTLVSEPLREVIQTALEYCRLSGGLYDVTISPVNDLWDFKADNPSLPDPDKLAAALELVGWEKVEVDGDMVRLAGRSQIDLGSIAKGYIADEMAGWLREQGVGSAIVNLGGNVLVVGSKPDGSPFSVGIQAPFEQRNELVGAIHTTDCSVVSSGVYERFFELDGVVYHHILHPQTGYPVQGDLSSVSIVCARSVDADALSTVCFLLGPDAGLALVERTDGVEAVFIMANGEERFSSGFEGLGFTRDV